MPGESSAASNKETKSESQDSSSLNVCMYMYVCMHVYMYVCMHACMTNIVLPFVNLLMNFNNYSYTWRIHDFLASATDVLYGRASCGLLATAGWSRRPTWRDPP